MGRKLYAALILALFWLLIAAFKPVYAQSLSLPDLALPAGSLSAPADTPMQAGKQGGKGTYSAEAGSALRLLSVRAEEDGDAALNIITVFSAKPDYSLLILDNPPRLIINLPPAQFLFDANAARENNFLRNFRYGASGAARARLVFSLKKPFALQNMRLEALSAKGVSAWQLILTLKPVSGAEFRRYLALARGKDGAQPLGGEAGGAVAAGDAMPAIPPKDGGAARKFRRRKNALFTVIIDPGHGGFDSGAVSHSGAREKNVTLAFAERLYGDLQKRPGIKPYLTRKNDVFLRLGERVEQAHNLNADLFISVHADYIDMPDLRGATVYSLSDKASDNLAALLAERENKSDRQGGRAAAAPPAVADILLDMTRRETQIFSGDFARGLIRALDKGKIALIKNPRRSADFQVLRTADIPSVLLELGYLSSPEDEKHITNPVWQLNVARIVADAVSTYAAERAPGK